MGYSPLTGHSLNGRSSSHWVSFLAIAEWCYIGKHCEHYCEPQLRWGGEKDARVLGPARYDPEEVWPSWTRESSFACAQHYTDIIDTWMGSIGVAHGWIACTWNIQEWYQIGSCKQQKREYVCMDRRDANTTWCFSMCLPIHIPWSYQDWTWIMNTSSIWWWRRRQANTNPIESLHALIKWRIYLALSLYLVNSMNQIHPSYQKWNNYSTKWELHGKTTLPVTLPISLQKYHGVQSMIKHSQVLYRLSNLTGWCNVKRIKRYRQVIKWHFHCAVPNDKHVLLLACPAILHCQRPHILIWKPIRPPPLLLSLIWERIEE